ncbi:methyltransferase type 11 [Methylorubrum populi]|uniref:Methyltransferase type 11 n=1 Tax=Methylobacterium radiotolerans TaxID=31998 RepID=A0ABU7TG44_9HYPH
MLRRTAGALARAYGALATLPFAVRRDRIAPPRDLAHGAWIDSLSERFDRPGLRVLEVGSRNVTGANFRHRFSRAEYVGFDFYAGENVDVVGDAHRLSSYFAQDERFDLIFSSAVFEHLAMPWLAAVEIGRLLKVGGHVFVETHFSFRSHERPWNFFQFSDMGLRALFNDALGFELIEKGMSSPIAGYFTAAARPGLRFSPITEMYGHSEILCRKRAEPPAGFDWSRVPLDAVVDGTRYPEPTPR